MEIKFPLKFKHRDTGKIFSAREATGNPNVVAVEWEEYGVNKIISYPKNKAIDFFVRGSWIVIEEKPKTLKDLIVENPELEMIFLYPDEHADDYYTVGKLGRTFVSRYFVEGDRIYVEENDLDDLKELYEEKLWEEIFNSKKLTDEQEKGLQEIVELRVKYLNWVDAIIVYIKP